MKFTEVVKKVYIEDLFTIKSRSSRLEYWLGAQLLGVVFIFFQYLTGDIGIVFYIWNLIATFTCAIRRLHDVEKSGWHLLWPLTILGFFYLLYLFVQPSQQFDNKWGKPRQHTVIKVETETNE